MPHKKTLIYSVIFALIVIPTIVFGLSKIFPSEKGAVLSAIDPIVAAIGKKEVNPLEKIVKEKLLENDKDYGVVIKNLKTGENYSINGEKEFQSASLYKLWVMGVAFQKIRSGQISEREVLTGSVKVFDEILSDATPTPSVTASSEPTIEPSPTEEKKISYLVGEAIEKMITASDNYAALLVASRSGSFAVTNFLKEYQFDNSNFRQPPKTTAKDIGSFFEKLYNGEIIDKDYSKKMIDILKKQTLNDRIPKYLPGNLEIAHKTGELINFKHDGGIVFTKKGDYIIVVLSDTKDPRETSEKIANFSKEIYDYFSK